MIVVDASMVVKLFREEVGSEQAEQLFAENSGALCGPDLLAIEVAAALVRNANMVKAVRPVMERALAEFAQMLREETIATSPTSPDQLVRAANLALEIGHPLKDCVYLALAMDLDCKLITCDAKFASKASVKWVNVQVLEG